MNRLYRNSAAALPLGLALGFWLALAGNFQLVVTSPKLLGDFSRLTLALSYGFLTTMAVAITTVLVLSLILSLVDIRGKVSPARHAGNVIGGVLFLLILSITAYDILFKGRPAAIVDPRNAFPVIGAIIFAYLLWWLISVFAEKYYLPREWGKAVINHYSITAGAGVFVFSTMAALFGTMTGRVYPGATIGLTAENVLYYPIFLVAGTIAWLVVRYILSRLSRHASLPIAIIALIAVIPLALFLRPAKANDPDKHNPEPGNYARNVVFISIDTLRYDRLGCDFNDHMQTPNIDSLARESVIFDNCIVPMPLTVPSHHSMLTGLMPRNHGIRVQASPINPKLPTITKVLSNAGLTCGGFVSMGLLSALNSGLDQGFQYFDDYWMYEDESRFFPAEVKYSIAGKIINKIFTGRSGTPYRYDRKAEKTIDSTIRWLDAAGDDDFFCFVHLFDPHWDYNAPEPYTVMYDTDYKGDVRYHYFVHKDILANRLKFTERDFRHIVSRYEGEVSYADAQLGRLFDRLRELDLWDETMIILTADHGESFEHGYFFDHASRVFQSTIHVPLIIKPYGRFNGARLNQLCSTTDIFPTICDALGLATPQGLDGVSLMPLVNGDAGADFVAHKYLFSEAYPMHIPQSIGRIYTVLMGTDKLIYSPYSYPFAPTYQFYNIANDPGEEHDIYASDNPLCEELAKLAEKWAAEDTDVANPMMNRSEFEVLKSLQYLD